MPDPGPVAVFDLDGVLSDAAGRQHFVDGSQGRKDWKAFFEGGMVRIGTLLFAAALLYHAWVGVRDIIMDYVKPAGVRLVAMLLVGLVLVAELFWAAAILWGR